MGRIIPYRTRYDREDNIIYDFLFEPTNKKEPHSTEIKIDELYDNLVIATFCSCPDSFFNNNKICKHKKQAMEILKEHGIEFEFKES